jgi:hypothetical protein
VLGLTAESRTAYRNFEHGSDFRHEFMESLLQKRWVDQSMAPHLDKLCSQVEVFSAFVTAFVAALSQSGLTQSRPDHYLNTEGWVYLPELSLPVSDTASVEH